MNHHVRLRQRATVFTCVCTGCGAVRDQPSRLVSLFLCLGRCRRYHEEGQKPPSPKGVNPRSRPHQTSADLLGARAERVPDCSSYLSRIPGSATDSGSSIHPRDSRGSPSDETLLSHRTGRHHALLNASAAGESTAAGSLKACLIKRQRC